MKCMTKYVASDVHQATTLASVRGECGRVLARTILPTEEPALVWRSGPRPARLQARVVPQRRDHHSAFEAR